MRDECSTFSLMASYFPLFSILNPGCFCCFNMAFEPLQNRKTLKKECLGHEIKTFPKESPEGFQNTHASGPKVLDSKEVAGK